MPNGYLLGCATPSQAATTPNSKAWDNLLKQLGHGSTEMLRRSYKRAVSKEEAEKFWSIFPPKLEEDKVIAFPARMQ
jgi:hypothetical protein